jgi:cell division protein FtsB
MKNLVRQRYLLRQNLLTVIGICLCCYFSYHIVFGARSLVQLMRVNAQLADVQKNYDRLHGQRAALESRVVRLRPGSLDRDLLEERARYVLGFSYPDERIIVGAD